MVTPDVTKTGKKQNSFWKLCLEASYGSLNQLDREYGHLLVSHNNRLPIQLLLSSEIGRFEDKQPQILTKTIDNSWGCT